MSAAVLSDPSGTGYNIYGNLYAVGGRADTVAGSEPLCGTIRPSLEHRLLHQSCAIACANSRIARLPAAIGRFGDEIIGLHRWARHAIGIAVADQAVYHQRAAPCRGWNASVQCIQPPQLCSAQSL